LMTNVVVRTTPEFLSSLPEGDINCDTQCVVCYENFVVGEATLQLPCGHIFHKECLVPWLERAHSCPFCRLELPGVAELPAQGEEVPTARRLENMTLRERNARIRLMRRLEQDESERVPLASAPPVVYHSLGAEIAVPEPPESPRSSLPAVNPTQDILLATSRPEVGGLNATSQPEDHPQDALIGVEGSPYTEADVTEIMSTQGSGIEPGVEGPASLSNAVQQCSNAVPTGMWACPQCTLHNDNSNSHCELCQEFRLSAVMPWEQTYTDGMTRAERNARIRALRRLEQIPEQSLDNMHARLCIARESLACTAMQMPIH